MSSLYRVFPSLSFFIFSDLNSTIALLNFISLPTPFCSSHHHQYTTILFRIITCIARVHLSFIKEGNRHVNHGLPHIVLDRDRFHV